MGQELRANDLTTDLTLQHGNRALASKDTKKTQGEHGQKSSFLNQLKRHVTNCKY